MSSVVTPTEVFSALGSENVIGILYSRFQKVPVVAVIERRFIYTVLLASFKTSFEADQPCGRTAPFWE
jgi:hypothetical protein